jgi:hypothetical protein
MSPSQGQVASRAFAATPPIQYNGGKVLTHPNVVVDFWGFATDPSDEKTRVKNFLSTVGGSSWLKDVTQYYWQSCSTCVKHFITNPAGILASTWDDNANAVSKSPSASDINTEVQRLAAHTSGADAATVYVIAFPHAHNPSWFPTNFCSFHEVAYTTADVELPIVLLPYNTDATVCGKNIVNAGPTGTLDGVSIVLGHELAEALTDPFGDAWKSGLGGDEIADLCQWQDLQNTSFGGKELGVNLFPTQPLYSLASNSCVQ